MKNFFEKLCRELAYVLNIVTDLQCFEPLEEPGFIRRLHHIGRALHLGHQLLEVRVDPVEALRVLRQLTSDVLRPDEDGLQMRPGPLYLEPDADDLVGRAELLLPSRDLLQEVSDELGCQHVLQLYLN